MKRLILVVLMIVAFPVMASHIVGGEFEIIHISGNTYRVNLILYFDLQNGSPDARDPSVSARIFRKRDNSMVQDVFLPMQAETRVDYTQPECSNGELQTSKLVYSTTIQMTAERYNDPMGYYISWERCCRNYNSSGLLNIVSEQPPLGVTEFPRAAGQTFYLEFPPVVKDGQPFINSTPQLFPPLNDYACPNKFYYADFAGTDNDGDSLAYSIITPLNTHNAEAIPRNPRPAPYPEVLWQSPFSLKNILGGKPDLKISTDGLLTVTPSVQGLFVFAVKCEEFRNGEKIGELRRDFQMLVVDACPVAEPPQIVGRRLNEADFTFDNNMSVTFSNTVGDEHRCIEVQVSDPDAFKQTDNFSERVRIKAVPIGFKKDMRGILPTVTDVILTKNSPTHTFSICFDECPPFDDGPFMVGIVAYDDACSLPYFDTLKVLINLEPPPNVHARFVTTDITETVDEGSPLKKWRIKAVDEDGDAMRMSALPALGFTLAQAGMTFASQGQQGDTLYAELTWDPACTVYDFSHRTNFPFQLLVEDADKCNFNHPDLLGIDLTIKLPGNHLPIIFSQELTNNDPTIDSVTLEKKINDVLSFHVTGRDNDRDKITLAARGKDFTLANYSMSFPQVTDYEQVTSLFTWNIVCDEMDLAARNEFVFYFIVTDSTNKCRYLYDDTLTVVVNLLPPDNQKPDLSVASLNRAIAMKDGNSIDVTLGQQIELALLALDEDATPRPDYLRLELINATGTNAPQGYIFANAENRGSVTSNFTWNPQCDIFVDGVYTNDYTFTFRVTDDRCFNAKGDTLDVNITIRDVDGTDKNFLPPNFITPNGDNKNDFFAMAKLDEQTGELISILPFDNCTGSFEGITIYNRWGKQVFESNQRDFQWHAFDNAAGVYYYQLKYSDKEYKGTITVAFSNDESSQMYR